MSHKFERPFLKLPIRFCAETLAAEVAALPPSAWVAHPSSYPGNDAVLLVTPNGEMVHGFAGPHKPTEHLRSCPYIMEVMAKLGAVWGRTRLMGLAPGADVPQHVDVNYHWRTHMRIHVPIVTTPGVAFVCDGETVHMGAGECWTFDSFRPHQVRNLGKAKRIHLVLDTAGGEKLSELLKAAESPEAIEPHIHKRGQTPVGRLRFERENVPKIMSPWELRCHIAFVREHTTPHPLLEPIFAAMDRFACAWTAAWAEFGPADDGIPSYQRLIVQAQQELKAVGGGGVLLPNGMPIYGVLTALIFRMGVPQSPRLAAA